MDRANEIEAVRRLGEEIGYGNLMDIASALWAVNLHKQYGCIGGAFIPAIAGDIKAARKKDYTKRQSLIIAEVSHG